MEGLNAYLEKGRLEAGCDEAGRGCLAGSVFAAAVILPPSFSLPGLNDSKKITVGLRRKLRARIEQESLAWAVASVSPEEIDSINVLNASFLAMHRAIMQLKIQPEFILVDGNRFHPYTGVPHGCFIKGDSRFASIAAASILAKTWRDEEMEKLDEKFPGYGWAQNKGYPTKGHREAIRKLGLTPYHRKTFRHLPENNHPSLF